MFVQEEFNSGSLTKFSNIQVAYRRSKGSAANKSKRNQPLLKLELVLKNRSLPYTLFTFKILEGNAFPIKNHFSFDIDVSDMEVEENIFKVNLFCASDKFLFFHINTEYEYSLNKTVKYKRGLNFLLMTISNRISKK